MFNYLRFATLIFFYYPLSYAGVIAGGIWPWLIIGLMVITQIIIDNLTSADKTTSQAKHPFSLDLLLYAHIPAGALMIYLLIWQVTPGDIGQTGQFLAHYFGAQVLQIHQEITFIEKLGCAFLSGFILSSNTIAGHELAHRISNPVALAAARLLLGMNQDAQFAIAHVFGHHARIGTYEDPATARRGESLYRFVIRSTLGQYREAWKIERERLNKKQLPLISFKNRFLTGILIGVVILWLSFELGGVNGLWAYAVAAIYSKFMLEAVNYIQHYGLVRVPNTRVEPHHSWDCISRAASNTFYMLPRHSEHHARPSIPYWKLKVSDLPSAGLHLKQGYLAAMMAAMVPPLWFHLTTPQLLLWDQRAASPQERELAHQANQRSGLKSLQANLAPSV